MLYIKSKKSTERWFNFPRKSEKLSKSRIFLGSYNRKTRWFWAITIEYSAINLFSFKTILCLHTLKLRPGTGPNSKNDQGVELSDKTRRAEYARISETSQRVANSEIKALWTWKFWAKNDTFFGYIVDFLATLGDRALFGG